MSREFVCINYMNNYIIETNDAGTKFWWLNGKLHREDGPAVELCDGSKYWYINNRLHREDGPAVEFANGIKGWYLNDIEYTESEWIDIIKSGGLN